MKKRNMFAVVLSAVVCLSTLTTGSIVSATSTDNVNLLTNSTKTTSVTRTAKSGTSATTIVDLPAAATKQMTKSPVTLKAAQTTADPSSYMSVYLTTTEAVEVHTRISDTNVAYIANIRHNNNIYHNQVFKAEPGQTYEIRINVMRKGCFVVSASNDIIVEGRRKTFTAASTLITSNFIKYCDHPYDKDKAYNKLNKTQKAELLSLKKKVEKAYQKIPANLRKWLEDHGLYIRLVYGSYMQSSEGAVKAIGLGSNKITICTGASNCVESTLYHEIGHSIQYYAAKYGESLNTLVDAIYDVNNTSYREYARKSSGEYWADTIGDYLMNSEEWRQKNLNAYAIANAVVNNPEAFSVINFQNIKVNIMQPHIGYTTNEFSAFVYDLPAESNKRLVSAKIGQKIKFASQNSKIQPMMKIYTGNNTKDFNCVHVGKNDYTFEKVGIYTVCVTLPLGNGETQEMLFKIKVTS